MHWWCIGVFGALVCLVTHRLFHWFHLHQPCLFHQLGDNLLFHVLANGERARVSEIEKNAKEKEPGADTLHPPPPPPLLPAAALPAPGLCLKT